MALGGLSEPSHNMLGLITESERLERVMTFWGCDLPDDCINISLGKEKLLRNHLHQSWHEAVSVTRHKHNKAQCLLKIPLPRTLLVRWPARGGQCHTSTMKAIFPKYTQEVKPYPCVFIRWCLKLFFTGFLFLALALIHGGCLPAGATAGRDTGNFMLGLH